MPLIDAFMSCDNIRGGYKATKGTGQAKLESSHNLWSEITSFKYDIGDDEHPSVTITKPIDAASNDLYIRFIKNAARDVQKGKNIDDCFIKDLHLELCRWVDSDNDGSVDLYLVFLTYHFKNCRITSYNTSIDFEADEIPEETLTFAFREMAMDYYYLVPSTEGVSSPQKHIGFECDFSTFETKDTTAD